MQVDMHYGATAVLARAAGFNEKDALVIGYAAQYVDDAQDGSDIRVNGQKFSPLATANGIGGYLHSKDRETWLKVYLPFHFLPPGPVNSGDDDFLTKPGGFLTDKLLESVAGEDWSNRLYHLCRLGVALHTVADTWSHQGFSGRWHLENDVETLQSLGVPQGFQQEMDEAWRDLTSGLHDNNPLPVVHFQAGFLPDLPFLEWRAVFKDLGQGPRELHLNNQAQYLEACRFIHGRLLAWPKDQPDTSLPWEQVEPGIKRCLAHFDPGREARCQRWCGSFAGLFPDSGGLPDYDKHQWEKQALGEPLRQDPVDNLLQALGLNHNYHGPADFARTPWVQFHKAARRQREWLGDYVHI